MGDDVRCDFSLYVVAFVDLCGQRAALKKVRGLTPLVSTEDDRWQVLRSCAFNVRTLRDEFATCMRQFQESPPPDTLPLAAREKQAAARRFDYNLFNFSDSLVISVPLHIASREPATAATGLLITLHSIAMTTLGMLQRGIAIRTGVDAGYGIGGLFEHEVYGPVALSAYELESKVASFPRAVVGKGVESAILAFEALARDNPHKEGCRRAGLAAGQCRRLLCQLPGEEHSTLDYLATEYPPLAPKVAAEWVREQRDVGCGSFSSAVQKRPGGAASSRGRAT